MSPPRRRRWSLPVDPYFLAGLLGVIAIGAIFVIRRDARSAPPSVTELPSTLLAELDELGVRQRIGDAGRPVQVVELADFQCPACASAHERTWPVLRRFLESGEVAFTVYDLPLPSHGSAIPAAVVAGCVADQQPALFWRLRDRLYRRFDAWVTAYPVEPALIGLAADVGADVPRLEECVRSQGGERAERLRSAWAAADAEGVRSIPVWTVNGRVVAWPDLEDAIAAASRGEPVEE